MAIFVLRLSNETNLKICMKESLAGFPKSRKARDSWDLLQDDDLISFYFDGYLYGLYDIVEKK